MSGFVVVIPARYGASRLPGKPLRLIAGRPLIEHVWRRAMESGAQRVIVATDDARIAECARAFGAEVSLTRDDHASGTDRIAEVAAQQGWSDDTRIVNLQGDEPLTPPALLVQVADALDAFPEAGVATLCTPIRDASEVFDPNSVKVVRDARGFALYFSRAPIPWERDAFRATPPVPGMRHDRHLGLYAYRAGFLRRYTTWPVGVLERGECLEQLRALENGVRIHVGEIDAPLPPGVDTEADLARVEAVLGEMKGSRSLSPTP